MESLMPVVLKELRLKNNLSQKELSKLINVSQRAYSFYETGAREPNISTLIKLADIFSVPLDILTGRYVRNNQ